MGTDAVSPLGRVGKVARQLHAISAGGPSRLKWETVPVPIFLYFAVSTIRADRSTFRCIVWNRRVWGFLRGFVAEICGDAA